MTVFNGVENHINLSVDDYDIIDSSIFDETIDRDKLTKCIQHVKNTINTIISYASIGNHTLSLSLSESETKIAFLKDNTGFVLISPNILHFVSQASLSLVNNRLSLLDLYSLVGAFTDSMGDIIAASPEELRNKPQEMRGWAVEDHLFKALVASDLIELHCLDALEDSMIDPDKNCVYHDGWNIAV